MANPIIYRLVPSPPRFEIRQSTVRYRQFRYLYPLGLELDLFVNQKEYIPILSPEAGVRVLIKRQRSIPFPVDEGFTVSPGFATSIGLRQVCLQ